MKNLLNEIRFVILRRFIASQIPFELGLSTLMCLMTRSDFSFITLLLDSTSWAGGS